MICQMTVPRSFDALSLSISETSVSTGYAEKEAGPEDKHLLFMYLYFARSLSCGFSRFLFATSFYGPVAIPAGSQLSASYFASEFSGSGSASSNIRW